MATRRLTNHKLTIIPYSVNMYASTGRDLPLKEIQMTALLVLLALVGQVCSLLVVFDRTVFLFKRSSLFKDFFFIALYSLSELTASIAPFLAFASGIDRGWTTHICIWAVICYQISKINFVQWRYKGLMRHEDSWSGGVNRWFVSTYTVLYYIPVFYALYFGLLTTAWVIQR